MTTIIAFFALLASLISPTAPYDGLPECDSRATVLQNCYWTADQHAAEVDFDFWVDSDFTVHWIDSDRKDGHFDYSALNVTPGMAPCEFEDSEGPCYWDARVRGNGQGESFTVTADQDLLYW